MRNLMKLAMSKMKAKSNSVNFGMCLNLKVFFVKICGFNRAAQKKFDFSNKLLFHFLSKIVLQNRLISHLNLLLTKIAFNFIFS